MNNTIFYKINVKKNIHELVSEKGNTFSTVVLLKRKQWNLVQNLMTEVVFYLSVQYLLYVIDHHQTQMILSRNKKNVVLK